MQNLLSEILAALERGECSMLTTVVESRGSVPRGAGAAMLVCADGRALGTIGGGILEHTAQQRAKALLQESREGAVEQFTLDNRQAGSLGMVCGGSLRVLFQRIAPGSAFAAVLRNLNERLEERIPTLLERKVEQGRVVSVNLLDGQGEKVSLLGDEESFTLLEPMGRRGRVLLFGGGHVSMALAPVLTGVDFTVAVLEDRPEFCTEERFPAAAQRLVGELPELIRALEIGREDYVVVMTRGHAADYEILSRVLKTPARYIGCIGSRSKVKVTRERLAAEGWTEADMDRIHAPIGLSIGAETPQEIAISIAAEMIACRAGKLSK